MPDSDDTKPTFEQNQARAREYVDGQRVPKPGKLLSRGVGPATVKQAILNAVGNALKRHGEGYVIAATALHSDAVAEFVEWFRRIEAEAAANTENPPIAGGIGAGGDGIPLSTAQRRAIELGHLLRRIMDDPDGMIEQAAATRRICA